MTIETARLILTSKGLNNVARMGERGGKDRVSVGKSERKTTLGKHRRRWEDNITVDLQEIG
jgi:hypothetical protein